MVSEFSINWGVRTLKGVGSWVRAEAASQRALALLVRRLACTHERCVQGTQEGKLVSVHLATHISLLLTGHMSFLPRRRAASHLFCYIDSSS